MNVVNPAIKTRTVLPTGNDKEVKGSGHRSSGKMVEGNFKNIEHPGNPHSFLYREFRGQSPIFYCFYENVDYEIPIEVANHLNQVGEKQMEWANPSGIIDPILNNVKTANPILGGSGFESPDSIYKVKRIRNRFAFIIKKYK